MSRLDIILVCRDDLDRVEEQLDHGPTYSVTCLDTCEETREFEALSGIMTGESTS